MAAERLVVIGGNAAGMSAASRARRLNPKLEIVVLEKGDTVSYGTCGLAYLISGTVRRAEDLIVYTPEFFRRQRDIEVRTGHQATEIVPGKKQVEVRSGQDGYSLNYDKLVLTAGGAPAETIPGADGPAVFTCNDLAGTLALRRFLEASGPRRAVIIGAGYIGLEVAEALRARNLEVTILERSATLLEDFEPEIGQWVQERLRQNGIQVAFDAPVKAIESSRTGPASVLYGAQQAMAADVVVLASGIVPRAALAARAGAQLGASGAIRTDDRQQTNLPSVYAAGDCVETLHLVTGGPAYLPLGTTANKQGRVAGENAAGGRASFPGVVGTLVTKVFDLEVGRTGLSEESARAAGFSPVGAMVEARSQAKYLSGKPLRAKLVADRASGRLLGGQLAGQEGAARRVDVLATALTARMTLEDFVHLDLGYAPPFGPVYDPLLVAAWETLKRLGRRR
ncbi:MAG: FAD-dependent oxidoreductase [Candidatus Acidoferrales bacterium]